MFPAYAGMIRLRGSLTVTGSERVPRLRGDDPTWEFARIGPECRDVFPAYAGMIRDKDVRSSSISNVFPAYAGMIRVT